MAEVEKKKTTHVELPLQHHLRSKNGPPKYQEEYSRLKSWTNSSPKLYKPELLRVLYAIFIHCLMDLMRKGYIQEAQNFFNNFREEHEPKHSCDLQKLELVLYPGDIEGREFDHSLGKSKANITLCQYSQLLLLQYLHGTHSTTMLGIVSDHISFQVYCGQRPRSISDDVEAVTLVGSQNTVEMMNEKEIRHEHHIKLNASNILRSVERFVLEDFRDRALLGCEAPRSVYFYTFLNCGQSLTCSSISRDGMLVAGGFSDTSLQVWDMGKLDQSIAEGENGTPTDQELGSSYTLFQGHSGSIHSVSFSPLEDYILSSSFDSTIRLWDITSTKKRICYNGHNGPVWDVQFSPEGNNFASCSEDGTTRIWTLNRENSLRTVHSSGLDCVQWHPSGKYVATGSRNNSIKLWDVDTGECARTFVGHKSMILSLAMSPDEKLIASGDAEGTIMLWDPKSGQCISPFMGHSSCVWTLEFCGEGSLLASVSDDCTLKLWNVNAASTDQPQMNERESTIVHNLLSTLPTDNVILQKLRFSRTNLLFAAGVLS